MPRILCNAKYTVHLPKEPYPSAGSDPAGMQSRPEKLVVFAAVPRKPCEMHFPQSN